MERPAQLLDAARPLQGRRFNGVRPALPSCWSCWPPDSVCWRGRRFRTPRLPHAGKAGRRAARDYLPRDQAASPSGSLQEILAHPDIIPTHHHPLLGRQAPDFELADPDGKVWNLRELQDGRPVVLIFYYGYHCIHCVRQLSDVNRDLPLFREVGARVVAISADPPELTRRTVSAKRPVRLPGPFGSRKQGGASLPGVQGHRTEMPMLRHGTFVIDRDGTVQWVNVGDAPFRRNSALLYQLAKMEGRLPSASEALISAMKKALP